MGCGEVSWYSYSVIWLCKVLKQFNSLGILSTSLSFYIYFIPYKWVLLLFYEDNHTSSGNYNFTVFLFLSVPLAIHLVFVSLHQKEIHYFLYFIFSDKFWIFGCSKIVFIFNAKEKSLEFKVITHRSFILTS